MTDAPPGVHELAQRRAQARSARDFVRADALRAEIAAAGWLVVDSAEGYALVPKPPYDVVADVHAIRPRTTARRAVVTLLVEGWPDDVRACLTALLEHAPRDIGVVALDLGNVDGAGDVAHEFAADRPEVVDVIHVATSMPFGAAQATLLGYDPSPVHVLMETSTILEGDAISPLLAAFEDPAVVGAGWRGANVDDDWRGFHDAGPGRVESVLGYFFAVRRDAALAIAEDPASPFAKARFYRNVDLELSYWLRDAGGALVVVPDLPVRQSRHRGYHDSDAAYRDRESKRNYDRFLQRFRDRDDLRLTR
ncbi:MAG: hypothetical protein ACJ735_17950 [Actinomycetes bacterium]